MITILCLTGVLIVSILMFVVAKVTEKYSDEHYTMKGVSQILIGVIALLILAVGLSIPISRANDRANVISMTQKYDVIKSRLDSNPEVWDYALTQSVIEYNSEVVSGRYWKNNPWTNVFYSDGWNDLKLIEIPNG